MVLQKEQTNEFVDALVHFAGFVRGVYGYVIGNEPKHENKRSGDLVTDFAHYSFSFIESRCILQSVEPGPFSIVDACALPGQIVVTGNVTQGVKTDE